MLILGAGSQARVIADLVGELGGRTVIGFVELGMNPSLVGTKMLGLPVIGTIEHLKDIVRDTRATEAALGYGDNRVRAELLAKARASGLRLPVLKHPSSVVSRHARIGDGSMIAAQAFVGTEAVLGEGCIVNTGASVDHNCVLGLCVSVAVGAHVAGGVTIGDLSGLGAGAVVVPRIVIGTGVMVGAGAAVVRNLEDGVTAVGVPARPTERIAKPQP